MRPSSVIPGPSPRPPHGSGTSWRDHPWILAGTVLTGVLLAGFLLLRVTEPPPLAPPSDEPAEFHLPLLPGTETNQPAAPVNAAVHPRQAPPARPPATPPRTSALRPEARKPPRAATSPTSPPAPVTAPRLPVGHAAMMRLQQLIASDLRGALVFCATLPEESQSTAYHVLFVRWAQQDPGEALRATQELPENLRSKFALQVLSQWSSADPQAALAQLVAANYLPAASKAEVALRLLTPLARQDPAAAWNALAALNLPPETPGVAELQGRILGGWITRDRETALAWLKNAALDDAAYDRAIISAVGQMIHTPNPDASAMALFREFVASGRMENIRDPALLAQAVYTAKSLGATLGAKDYDTAMQWAAALPAGSQAQAYVLSNVAFSQTHGAQLPEMGWIETLEPGFVRTRTVTAVTYGRLLANGNTAAGQELRQQQLDPDAYDPARTRALVEQAELPPAEKTRLLALLR